jgi:hypothetical protein
MTKTELVETLERMGFSSDDGEDYSDGHGRSVRFVAPRVGAGQVAVLWREPGEGVPQRRVVAFAEAPALVEAAPRVDPGPSREFAHGPALGSVDVRRAQRGAP